MRATRTLAQVYRQFADVAAARSSPLYHRVALGLAESGPALGALGKVPAGRRRPVVVLAALHHLALAGRAPELAAAYVAADGAAAAAAAVGTLVEATDAVAELAVARRVADDECSRSTVLLPLIAAAVQRTGPLSGNGATALGLVDLGRPAGLNLIVDGVDVTYGNGQSSGDGSSPVQLSADVVGDGRLPDRRLPAVVARVLLAREPLDVTDAGDVRWLRACVWPDHPTGRQRLDAELAMAATAPPVLLSGDPIDALPAALALVPAGVLPIVMTTWALSSFPVERRLEFRRHLERAGADRPVAWVSAEGVGVAPGIPTLGDRPASGHSILGLAVADRSGLRAEAVGRCWSRGAMLAWLADDQRSGVSPSAGR